MVADSYVQVVGGDVMRFAYRYREYESNLITYLIFRIRKFWLFNLTYLSPCKTDAVLLQRLGFDASGLFAALFARPLSALPIWNC